MKNYDFPKSGLEEHFKENNMFMVVNYDYKTIKGEEISVDCLLLKS